MKWPIDPQSAVLVGLATGASLVALVLAVALLAAPGARLLLAEPHPRPSESLSKTPPLPAPASDAPISPLW